MDGLKCFAGVVLLVLIGSGIWACNNAASKNTMKATQDSERLENRNGEVTQPQWKDQRSASLRDRIVALPMKSKDGRVIGVLFSTPNGDVCELRDGGNPEGAVSVVQDDLTATGIP